VIIEHLQDYETFAFNPEAYPHLLFSPETRRNHSAVNEGKKHQVPDDCELRGNVVI